MIFYVLSIFIVLAKSIGPEHKFITVHAIAHSHDDVGFVKTYDEYYFGNTIISEFAFTLHIVIIILIGEELDIPLIQS